MSARTRNGKIARLPDRVREQLNDRLRDGEQGKTLVRWLNSLPEVAACMKESFGGEPLKEQNLSEWRKGGYQDWLRHREDMELAWRLGEEGEELAYEAGILPVSDRIAPMAALALARMIREVISGNLKSPRHQKKVLGLCRELTSMRRTDHEAAWLKIELKKIEAEEWERECQKLKKESDGGYSERVNIVKEARSRNMTLDLLTLGMTPEGAEALRNYVLHGTELKIHKREKPETLNGTAAPDGSNSNKPSQSESDLVSPNSHLPAPAPDA